MRSRSSPPMQSDVIALSRLVLSSRFLVAAIATQHGEPLILGQVRTYAAAPPGKSTSTTCARVSERRCWCLGLLTQMTVNDGSGSATWRSLGPVACDHRRARPVVGARIGSVVRQRPECGSNDRPAPRVQVRVRLPHLRRAFVAIRSRVTAPVGNTRPNNRKPSAGPLFDRLSDIDGDGDGKIDRARVRTRVGGGRR